MTQHEKDERSLDRQCAKVCVTEARGGHPRNGEGKFVAYYVTIRPVANPLYPGTPPWYAIDLWPLPTRCPSTSVVSFRAAADAEAWIAANVDKRQP